MFGGAGSVRVARGKPSVPTRPRQTGPWRREQRRTHDPESGKRVLQVRMRCPHGTRADHDQQGRDVGALARAPGPRLQPGRSIRYPNRPTVAPATIPAGCDGTGNTQASSAAPSATIPKSCSTATS